MATIDPQWIVSLKGKDYPTWPGILDAATKAGLRVLKTTLIQNPEGSNGNLAIVMATAIFEDGREFTDIGDAGPGNCSPQIASAACRMASTRAKGRVLRDALNIGQTMWEELPDDEKMGANGAAHGPRVVPAPAAEPKAAAKGADLAVRHGPVCQICSAPLPANVYRLAMTEFGSGLCIEHGKERRKQQREQLYKEQEERLAAEREAAAA